MTTTIEDGKAERMALARGYAECLERGDEQAASERLRRLNDAEGDQMLFTSVGKLTREIHESMKEFLLDPRLTELTSFELSDAKERLNYVVSMTEQAANSTLTALETISPLMERIATESTQLSLDWQRFRARELNVEEFRLLSSRLAEFLERVGTVSGEIQHHLSDILMAQSYQDLTGQVVRNVSLLVQDVEEKLVQLVRLSGKAPPAPVKGEDHGGGPAIPGVNDAGRLSGQDEVDNLLSELGF